MYDESFTETVEKLKPALKTDENISSGCLKDCQQRVSQMPVPFEIS